MNRDEVAALLDELALPPTDFAVHGSAAMLLRGLIEEVDDLDLVARGAAWRRACALAAPEPGSQDLAARPLPGVEVWSGWLGDDVDTLIDGAELVEGWPCVRLQAVLAFKTRLARPKDRAHVALLRARLGEARPGPRRPPRR